MWARGTLPFALCRRCTVATRYYHHPHRPRYRACLPSRPKTLTRGEDALARELEARLAPYARWDTRSEAPFSHGPWRGGRHIGRRWGLSASRGRGQVQLRSHCEHCLREGIGRVLSDEAATQFLVPGHPATAWAKGPYQMDGAVLPYCHEV
jgi:hypothetical protein